MPSPLLEALAHTARRGPLALISQRTISEKPNYTINTTWAREDGLGELIINIHLYPSITQPPDNQQPPRSALLPITKEALIEVTVVDGHTYNKGTYSTHWY